MFEGKMTVSCILLIMMMVHGMKSEDILPTPNGIKFLGIGYNIIEGNPEGGGLISGGVDPGLLVSRRVFDLHYDNGKTSNDGQYRIPDEVYFLHRQSAYTSATRTTFHGTSSYQSKLSAQVSVSASVGGFFAKARFAASARYQRIATRTSNSGSVFLATEEVKNLGHARYLTELARPERHRLNAGFVAASCNLPGSYDEAAYMEFLDTWGTHVVTEVDLGTREGENYEEDRSSFVKYASQHVGVSVSASATVIGKFGASLAVDMESFNRAMESGTSFGSSYTKYKLGSDTLREPISLTMIGMHELFDDDYWTRLSEFVDSGHCTNSWNRTDTRSNMLKAMKGYAKWKQISESGDPSIVVPVTWPEGTYGLPKPISGCPNTEFTWNEGYRLHDTEYYSHNHWTNPLNLDGHTALYSVQQHFCMKTVDTVDSNSHWFWQPGSYCIYKYGDCPSGFQEGWIFWNDEDLNNINQHGGTLPDGVYNWDTKMYFCCRNDGVTDHPIYLPTDDSFFLFPRFEHCQEVYGMTWEREWLYWNTDDSGASDSQSDVHPYEGVKPNTYRRDVKLHFCHYNRTLETSP